MKKRFQHFYWWLVFVGVAADSEIYTKLILIYTYIYFISTHLYKTAATQTTINMIYAF